MVLTVSFALSQVIGLVCHLRWRDAKHHRQLDANHWGVRTTRLRRPQECALVRSAARVHRIPALRSWRSRNAPLCGPGWNEM